MARKPCAQDVEKFIVDPKYCGCKEQSGRFSRIARNAILPFYYNCPPGADLNNKNKTCEKVFYIKNPKYFAGAAANNPGSQVTQAMRFAALARKDGRTIDGRRQTQVLPPSNSCVQYGKNIVWYGGLLEYNIQTNILGSSRKCFCNRDVGIALTNN